MTVGKCCLATVLSVFFSQWDRNACSLRIAWASPEQELPPVVVKRMIAELVCVAPAQVVMAQVALAQVAQVILVLSLVVKALVVLTLTVLAPVVPVLAVMALGWALVEHILEAVVLIDVMVLVLLSLGVLVLVALAQVAPDLQELPAHVF